MSEFREDTLIYPIAVDLVACLASEIEDSGLPVPCMVALQPGGEVPLDYCSCDGGTCGGQAWVRLGSAYPTKNFPIPDATGTCGSTLAFELEIAIARCAPVGTGRIPPTLEQRLEVARLQFADMMAMHRAIQCCMSMSGRNHSINPYQPFSGGDCVGGLWGVALMVENNTWLPREQTMAI